MPADTASPPPAEPDPGAPDTAPATQHAERTLGGRGRVIGASEILRRAPATATGTNPAPKQRSKRRPRGMSLPPDIAKRAKTSGLNRRDLILIAAKRHGDDLARIPRYNVAGRVNFQVRLDDDEHERLRRIARRRGWPLSPTVAALIDLYLTKIEDSRDQTTTE